MAAALLYNERVFLASGLITTICPLHGPHYAARGLEVLRGGQFNSKIVQSEFKQSSKTLMSVRRKRIYEFGAYRLDESERTLSRDGQALPLPAKAFDTLLLLVGNRGHLLEKDELMRRLWPDTFVEEANLTNNISLLRKALASGAAESAYIETVPRRGYRFIGGVRELGDEEGELVVERHTVAGLSIGEGHEVADKKGRGTEEKVKL